MIDFLIILGFFGPVLLMILWLCFLFWKGHKLGVIGKGADPEPMSTDMMCAIMMPPPGGNNIQVNVTEEVHNGHIH